MFLLQVVNDDGAVSFKVMHFTHWNFSSFNRFIEAPFCHSLNFILQVYSLIVFVCSPKKTLSVCDPI